MIYELRTPSRSLGDFEGADPCAAIAAMLLARGHVSKTSAALLGRVLEGIAAVPLDVVRARNLERFADGCVADTAREPAQRDAYADQAGRQRGLAFRIAERAAL